MTEILKVGIIGASAQRGWARISHVPAVQGLPGLELGAVVSSDRGKAEAAARAFGARIGYGDADSLFRDPGIDIVSVCVKVPDHRALVLAALQAGKHVYCEWPLGRDLAETEELAAAARNAGVCVALGLQARRNPAALRARDLIANGAIGRILGARVYSSTVAFGAEVEAAMAFAEDPASGVNLVTIQAAHTIDLAIAVVGELADLSALAARQYPEVQFEKAGWQSRSTFDHVLTQARLAAGGTLGMEVVGGRPMQATPFRLEVTGEKGEVSLDGGAPRGFQSGRLRLSLNGEQQAVDEGELSKLPDEAANVAGIYAALRDDIAHGTSIAPGFEHAVRLARLIDDVTSSSRTGMRKPAADWPVAI